MLSPTLNFLILHICNPGFCPAPFQAGSVAAESFLTCQRGGEPHQNKRTFNMHCFGQFLSVNACNKCSHFVACALVNNHILTAKLGKNC